MSGCSGRLHTDTRLMASCQICLPPYLFRPKHLAVIVSHAGLSGWVIFTATVTDTDGLQHRPLSWLLPTAASSITVHPPLHHSSYHTRCSLPRYSLRSPPPLPPLPPLGLSWPFSPAGVQSRCLLLRGCEALVKTVKGGSRPPLGPALWLRTFRRPTSVQLKQYQRINAWKIVI